MPIRLEIKGLKEITDGFERAPKVVDEELTAAMQKSVITAESAVKPLTPVGVSGRLRSSIGSEVTRPGGMEIVGRVGSGVSKDDDYPMVMEEGRKPGSAPPPASRLERWVRLQMMVPEEYIASVAADIALSISKKGIKGHFMFQKGLEQSADKIKGFFEDAIERIVERL